LGQANCIEIISIMTIFCRAPSKIKTTKILEQPQNWCRFIAFSFISHS
jgi:hypothetical protein